MNAKQRRRHWPEQIFKKLRDADAMLSAGQDVAAVLQSLELREHACAGLRLVSAYKLHCQAWQRPRAIPHAFDRHADALQHRDKQIHHRRVFGVLEMAAGSDVAAPFAGHQNR